MMLMAEAVVQEIMKVEKAEAVPVAQEQAQTPVAQPETAPKRAPRKRAPKPPATDAPDARVAHVPKHILLFNKYSYDVKIADPSLVNYINLKPLVYPETFRRHSNKKFSKAELNIIERFANDLMRGGTGGKISGKVIRTKGRLQGKKFTVMRIIEAAFDKVQQQTGQNPIQILVRALEYAAPIEDTTRVRYGGIISNIPVDVSASRRLDIAIRNLAMATIIGSFGNKKNIVDTMANELILASRADVNSYAVKRKNEIERMARSAK
jgi:small subunit ribosomal protein S7